MYSSVQKLFNEKLDTVSLFILFIFHLVLLGSGVYLFSYLEGNLSSINLLNWDTGWYLNIRDNGYFYIPDQQSSVAFFPLFPYLWRFSHLSDVGISIFNIITFWTGILLLTKTLDIKGKYIFLYLSIPSAMFFFVPYSESIFFLFGILILVGFKKEKTWLICLGLFLSALTRSAGAIFLPALFITWILLNLKNNKKQSEFILYILSVLAGVLIVSYINYYQTGQWFGFMTIQSQWGHHLQIPHIPFNTWGDSRNILRTDGIALMIGISSIILLAGYLLSLVSKKAKLHLEGYQIFSLLYLAGVTSIVLLFEGGGLQSINRYIFASPYFFLLLPHFITKIKPEFSSVIKVFIIVVIFWTIFFYNGQAPKFIVHYCLTTCCLAAYFFINNKKYGAFITIFLFFFNLFFQILFLSQFLQGKWVA